jgi:hypothetical protein
MSESWRVDEASQTSARQGKNGQPSGVYTTVHEHWLPVFNAVSRRLRRFSDVLVAVDGYGVDSLFPLNVLFLLAQGP